MSAIDLRSDTVTTPTAAMYRAMVEAPVGDDVLGDDPTVAELERRGARCLRKEAALLFPSGTMANLAALMTHASPGDEVILERKSHINWGEGGGISRLAGLQPKPVDAPGGALPVDVVRELIVREDAYHAARTTLICIENTHNARGGIPLTAAYTSEIAALAAEADLRVHLDGARIFNAAVALGVPVHALTEPADSVMICLSKGLSAPIGSLLAGERELIDRARKTRQMLGGGMRQAGVIAAAGILALEEMPDRIPEDHRLAVRLAEGLTEIEGLGVLEAPIRTNMVFVEVKGGIRVKEEILKRLGLKGVLCQPWTGTGIRMVTHRGITEGDIDAAVDAFRSACEHQKGGGLMP